LDDLVALDLDPFPPDLLFGALETEGALLGRWLTLGDSLGSSEGEQEGVLDGVKDDDGGTVVKIDGAPTPLNANMYTPSCGPSFAVLHPALSAGA